MKLPRVTGLLNNCALSCALPWIVEGILHMAEREAAGTLDAVRQSSVVQSYQKLKTIFARVYGLENVEQFNWQVFDAFLKQHSFYAQELLFAPVVRAFVAEIGLESGDYQLEDLGGLQDLQGGVSESENSDGEVIPQGRYNMLSVEDANQLFYRPFGLVLEAYNHVPGSNPVQYEPHNNPRLVPALEEDYPFGLRPTFALYLKGGHFELQPHEKLSEANQEFIQEINGLPRELLEVHEGLSMSQTIADSQRQLENLKTYGTMQLMMLITKREQDALAAAAGEATRVAEEARRETGDPIYTNVIVETNKIVENPTKENLQNYQRLQQEVSQKGSLGMMVAGAMLVVIGIATTIVSVLSLVATLGASAPIAAPTLVGGMAGFTLGIGLFKKGLPENEPDEGAPRFNPC